jgi:hypothetical protein
VKEKSYPLQYNIKQCSGGFIVGCYKAGFISGCKLPADPMVNP